MSSTLHDSIDRTDDAKLTPAPVDLDNDSMEADGNAQKAVHNYFWEHVPDYRRLYELRKKGWESVEGDKHFKKQREISAKPDEDSLRFFYNMMQTIGKDMDKATGAFKAPDTEKPALLDMCMAPGGFVAHAMKKIPHLRVRAMTLANEDGGHAVRLVDETVQVEFYDVTTLAADMGVVEEDVPTTFPRPHGLLFKKVFTDEEKFDIAICGGAVVRTHQRQEWREKREANRLTLTQLALSLEHLNPGGTMVILLHKPETWRCFHLIQQLSQIARVQMFKHHKHHGIRSAFYVIAKEIRADSPLAHAMVAEWKQQYKIATLSTDEEYYAMHRVSNELVEAKIKEFGEEYVEMGKNIWKTQADALERAPFIKFGSGGHRRHRAHDQ
ncbi:hypothetical protein IL306_005394 [Fusarium sp. DS 682]|nr:hypothetical protein IL306_005394 [Fusarium sp. DS 682]